MDVITVKVISGLLFFSLVVLFGGLPFWFLRKCASRFKTGETQENHLPLVNYLHSMASGVLVATCLLSLLPEAIEAVHETLGSSHTLEGRRELHMYSKHPDNETNTDVIQSSDTVELGNFNYPIAELLVAFGFLSIYMLDSSFKAAQSSYSKKKNDETRKKMYELREKDFYSKSAQDEYEEINNDSVADRKNSLRNSISSEGSLEDLHKNSNQAPAAVSPDHTDTDTMGLVGDDHVAGWGEEHPLTDRRERQVDAAHSQSLHLRSVVLVAVLCIHGFFDGILLGLQTSMHVLLSLLLALSVHKSFVSISLSITLFNHHVKHQKTSRVALYVLLFSFAAPLGLIISAGIVHGTSSEEEGPGLAAGCLQAFAVGTFMYVAFTETMEQQRTHGKSFRTQILSHTFLILGFAAMAGLRAALGEV